MPTFGAEPPFLYAGELACMGAALIWALSLTTFRRFGAGVAPDVLNLFKTLVAIVCLGAVMLMIAGSSAWNWQGLAFLAVSGIIGLTIGDTALFAAMGRLGAQLGSALQCLAPPMTVVLASTLMAEHLTSQELLGLLVTTVAVGFIVYRGRSGGVHLQSLSRQTLVSGVGYAFLAALGQAVGVVLTRHGVRDVDPLVAAFARLLPASIVLWGMVWVRGGVREIGSLRQLSPRTQGMLFAAAFFGTFIGIVLATIGTKYTKAGVAAALTSSYPIWVVPIAFVMLKEKPKISSILATAVAVGGIGLMFLS